MQLASHLPDSQEKRVVIHDLFMIDPDRGFKNAPRKMDQRFAIGIRQMR